MKRQHRLPCLLSSIALAMGVGMDTAQAADAPVAAPAAAGAAVTRQGLETLHSALPASGPADDIPRARVTARRGETVDGIIRRTMGDMPFKEAFLRGVFLEINAGVVQPGTMRLVAGAQLQLPNVSDLRSHLQRVLEASSPAGQPAPAASATSSTDKRHWVRFP